MLSNPQVTPQSFANDLKVLTRLFGKDWLSTKITKIEKKLKKWQPSNEEHPLITWAVAYRGWLRRGRFPKEIPRAIF